MGSLRHQRGFSDPLHHQPTSFHSLHLHSTAQPRTTPSSSPRNRAVAIQARYRTGAFHTRFLKSNVCHRQTQRGSSTHLQPQALKFLRARSTFSDGNFAASRSDDQAKRLSCFLRPTRPLSAYSHPSAFKKIPAISFRRKTLSIPNRRLWFGHGSLVGNVVESSHSGLGSLDGDTGHSISRRLVSDGADLRVSSPAHAPGDPEASSLGMADQLAEVEPTTFTTNRAFGVSAGHHHHDSSTPRVQGSQLDDAYQGRHHRHFSGASLHTGSHALQEPICSSSFRLGPSSPPSPRLSRGTSFVASELGDLEWPFSVDSFDTASIDGGRQRQGLGGGDERHDGSRRLDLAGADPVDQLTRTQGDPIGTADLSQFEADRHIGSHGQHDGEGIRQQARWDTLIVAEQVGDGAVGDVSDAGPANQGSTHPRHPQYGGGQGVEGPTGPSTLAPAPTDIPSSSAILGLARRGSVCRSGDPSASPICGSLSGPRRNSHGCDDSLLALLQAPLDPSTMEPHSAVPPQDRSRTGDGDTGGALLAIGSVVPSSPASGDSPSTSAESPSPCRVDVSLRHLSVDKSTLEAQRVAGIRNRFAGQGYSSEALTRLCSPLLRASSSNRTYLSGQRRFVFWASQTGVDLNEFSATDLVNFLSAAHEQGYSVGTIKIFRSAVLVFHRDGTAISSHPDLVALIRRLTRDAPPRATTRPSLDITPTLRYLGSIPSASTTSLALLNQKTAFLLATAAFLRPSDLHRIQLSQCRVDDAGRLHLCVRSPKETRGGRRIIKTLVIHPFLDTSLDLCPVTAFTALRDHPDAAARPLDALLVNSQHVSSPLQVPTVSGWLRRLMRRSGPSATLPSLRSVASDLALTRGAALDAVLTMGNWSSHTVFDEYYRRTRQISDNISSRVLRVPPEGSTV